MSTCPANGCGKPIARRLLMCQVDWRRVPKEIQKRVYAAYRSGNASAWLDARAAAILAVDAYNRIDR